MTSNNPQNDLFVPLKHIESIVLVAKLHKQSNVQWWEENGVLTPFYSINPEFANELGNAVALKTYLGSFHEYVIPYGEEIDCITKLKNIFGERIMKECCCFIQTGFAEMGAEAGKIGPELGEKETVELNFGIAATTPQGCERFCLLVPLTIKLLPSEDKLTNPRAGGQAVYY